MELFIAVHRPAPPERCSLRCRVVVRLLRTIPCSVPSCKWYVGHCVRCHPVRDTPDDSSRRLMAQEKRFTLLPYLTFTAGQGSDWKRLSQETYPQRLIV